MCFKISKLGFPKVYCCSTEMVHIWPYVDIANMCLRSNRFFSIFMNLFTFSAACLQFFKKSLLNTFWLYEQILGKKCSVSVLHPFTFDFSIGTPCTSNPKWIINQLFTIAIKVWFFLIDSKQNDLFCHYHISSSAKLTFPCHFTWFPQKKWTNSGKKKNKTFVTFWYLEVKKKRKEKNSTRFRKRKLAPFKNIWSSYHKSTLIHGHRIMGWDCNF